LDDRIAAFDDPEAARKAFIARQPTDRLGRAEKVAAVAVHLAADESAFTTGTAVVVDGGFSL
jgi:2-keto-3-deoxy-L-fuconate dehydrogenase